MSTIPSKAAYDRARVLLDLLGMSRDNIEGVASIIQQAVDAETVVLVDALKAVHPWLGFAVGNEAFRDCALPLAAGIALQQLRDALASIKGQA
jgi:hypothetical protein